MALKDIAGKLLILVITILFLMAATEVVLSLLHIPAYSTYYALYRTPHEVWNHGFIPNTTGRMITLEYDINLSINSFGMRSPEPKTPKSAFRILMLGDSFTEGVGVNWEDSFGGSLQKILDKKGYKTEVLSAGVLSHSPVLEWLFLQHNGGVLMPDLVLLNLDLSDFFDDYRYEKIADRNSDGEIIAVPGSREPPTWRNKINYFCDWYRLNTCTLLINFYVKFRRHVLGIRPDIIVGDIESDRFFVIRDNISKEKTLPHYQRTFSYIQKIEHSAKELNASFILVLYPYGFQVNENEWKGGRWLWHLDDKPVYPLGYFQTMKDFSRRAKIPVIDTFYKFNASQNKSAQLANTTNAPLFLPMDGHFTPRGYGLVSQAIADHLIAESVLPPPQG